MKDELHIEKPIEKVAEQKVVENQIIQDEATLSHSSQLASELDTLTKQTEKLYKNKNSFESMFKRVFKIIFWL